MGQIWSCSCIWFVASFVWLWCKIEILCCKTLISLQRPKNVFKEKAGRTFAGLEGIWWRTVTCYNAQQQRRCHPRPWTKKEMPKILEHVSAFGAMFFLSAPFLCPPKTLMWLVANQLLPNSKQAGTSRAEKKTQSSKYQGLASDQDGPERYLSAEAAGGIWASILRLEIRVTSDYY